MRFAGFLSSTRAIYHFTHKKPAKRKFTKIFNTFNNMKINLTKRAVATVAQALTIYKHMHPETMHPMRDAYAYLTEGGAWLDSDETKERFVRVARLLGWSVSKTGNKVFENGAHIWTIGGN